MRRRAPSLLTMVCLVAGACSAKTPTGEGPPPSSPPPSESPTPSPEASTPKPPVARFAVYALEGAIHVYDVREDTSREVARGAEIRLPQWVSRNEISFLQGREPTILRILDLRTAELRDVFRAEGGIEVYGWSPDRETVAYVARDERDFPHIRYRSLAGEGATRTVATLARAAGRGAGPDDQLRVEFSPDGELVLVVYTFADGDGRPEVPDEQSQLQVRTVHGELSHAAKLAGEPTMGAWAPGGDRLFYRTTGGARSWTPATGRTRGVASRPAWFNPSPSRDGRFIAYDTGSGRTDVGIRILDLRTGGIRAVGRARRFHPVYASGRTVWAQRVRRCDLCPGPVEPVDEVYALDLRSGKEKRLAIRGLLDADVLYR